MIATPTPADNVTSVGPVGVLERIQFLLNNAGKGIDTLSAKVWKGIAAQNPTIADPTKALVERSVEIADASTTALLEGVLTFGKNNAYDTSPSWQRFEEGLRSYWRIETDPRTGIQTAVKSDGGGVAYLAKAISQVPEVKRAMDATITALSPTRLLDALNETHKVLLLLAGVAAYGAQAVKTTRTGFDVNLPGIGGFSISNGKIRDIALDLSGNLAKIGPRGRSIAASMSTRARTSDGDKVSAGVAVPVARRATVDVNVSALRAPSARPSAEVSVSYKTYLSPSSDIALRTTAAQQLSVGPSGRIEPRGDQRIYAELTGPLPELNRRLRNNRGPSETAVEARKDALAMRIIRSGRKGSDGKTPLYSDLMRKSLAELEQLAT